MGVAYAGNYNGICVEYDAIHIFRKYRWRMSPVKHVEKVSTIDYNAEEAQILKYIHRICIEKTYSGIKKKNGE